MVQVAFVDPAGYEPPSCFRLHWTLLVNTCHRCFVALASRTGFSHRKGVEKTRLVNEHLYCIACAFRMFLSALNLM
ncbi:hypothetical protein GGTG_09374 [Gaeumannomyces tritici R3-111a-1]|uniref:Uncharacterized protein n=1 Tax=Gaeumannomyces tritici (strain R3-111a-1) TaxID=644352 RepID=J3P777_GAET3|nr:hypothetical protein GGTG_09374 [Gaeumannomyces tritici R3-111a-1]EJT72508.1 hypothetical protein GGTG_09374 [Gaeumannomyces tritici R3-111a-1]